MMCIWLTSHDNMFWDYDIVIEIMYMWQIEYALSRDIHVYRDVVVCIDLWAMSCTITQLYDPLRDDELMHDKFVMGSTVKTQRV